MLCNERSCLAFFQFRKAVKPDGITLGITSTGRDGETQDLVTGTEKPKVYLYEDTIVSN